MGGYYDGPESRFSDDEWERAEQRIRDRRGLDDDDEVDAWDVEDEAEKAREPDPDDLRDRDWDRRNLD